MSSEKKQPSHRAYHVKGEGEKARWLELGAVWAHGDGKGYDVVLDRMPIAEFDGRITLRAIDARPKE